MTVLTKQNGKNDQNFLCPKIEVGATAGAQAEWMQNDLIEEGKPWILLCLRLPAPPLIPFGLPATTCMPTQTTHYPTSNKYMLALIAINQMDKGIQALSSRQRAPPSVCPSASGVRAPPQVRKSRVKGGVGGFGRRPWVGARQGRRQREDRLHCRVNIWSAATLGVRSSGHGTPLRLAGAAG